MKKIIGDVWGKIKHYFRRSPSLKEVVWECGDMTIKMFETHVEIVSNQHPGTITLVRK